MEIRPNVGGSIETFFQIFRRSYPDARAAYVRTESFLLPNRSRNYASSNGHPDVADVTLGDSNLISD